MFAGSLSILVAFSLFMLRPFLAEAKGETKRLAELLSMLPGEINVEDVVNRTLMIPGTYTSTRENPAGEEGGEGGGGGGSMNGQQDQEGSEHDEEMGFGKLKGN